MFSGSELCTGRALIQCDGSTHCDNENKVRLPCGTVHRCQPAGAHRIPALQRQSKGCGVYKGRSAVILGDQHLRQESSSEKQLVFKPGGPWDNTTSHNVFLRAQLQGIWCSQADRHDSAGTDSESWHKSEEYHQTPDTQHTPCCHFSTDPDGTPQHVANLLMPHPYSRMLVLPFSQH